MLTSTIDAQIADDDKQHPAKWLNKLSQHYLGEKPIMQSTHNFLSQFLKQEPGMSIQDSRLAHASQIRIPKMQILNYDVDTVNLTALIPAMPPLGELTLDTIKLAYPHLFEGLGELDEPFSSTLNPDVKPIQAAPHRYAAPKLPVIKEASDKLVDTGQLVRVNAPTPWIPNMVVRERPATSTKPAKVCICLDPSQTINKAIIRPKTSTIFTRLRFSPLLTSKMHSRQSN